MNEIIIKTVELTDIPEIINLEDAEWELSQRCSAEKFYCRFENFRNGFLVGWHRNKVVASFYAIRRNRNQNDTINWARDSGYGTGDTHDASGNSLFSVSITVSRAAPKGTYRRMMQAWRELAVRQHINYIYAGSRLPGLSSFAGQPDEYLAEIKFGRLFDPILSKAVCCGFSIGKLVAGYFRDCDSRDYGVEIFQKIELI